MIFLHHLFYWDYLFGLKLQKCLGSFDPGSTATTRASGYAAFLVRAALRADSLRARGPRFAAVFFG
jgi:hypothetical protein